MVSVPEPLPVIKIEDDTPPSVTVIDVDSYVSTQDKITNWQKKVRQRINNTFGIECQTSLENLMKWYIDILNQELVNLDANRRFIQIMDKHLYCFYSYFKALNWISADGYLEAMEDILAFYLDCEGKIFVKELSRQKRNKKQMRKKLLPLLRIYLLAQEERIHHVLMKMRLSMGTEEAKSFFDNIFRVVFAQKAIDKSDAAFCRAFILHQKWKHTQKSDIWKVLDEMLETMYARSIDSIHTNVVWKELQPNKGSLLDVIAHFGKNERALCDSYFDYMKAQNAAEDIIDVGCFMKTDDLSKPELDLLIDIDVDIGETSESSEFNKLMESCSMMCETEAYEEDRVVKEEVNNDSDDDCVIITNDAFEIDPQKVVYEILDGDNDQNNGDDDGIIEFADLNLKEPYASISNSCTRRPRKDEEVSFLDSIEITQNCKATAGEKTALQTDSVSPPLTKLQNSDNDSVKARETLSRKFTRKKEATPAPLQPPPPIVSKIESLDDSTTDDRTRMHMPHSTISINNSPKSTTAAEIRPRESYDSPTSPDISSTCAPNAVPQDEFNLSDDDRNAEAESAADAEQTMVLEERQIETETISDQQIETELVVDEVTEVELLEEEGWNVVRVDQNEAEPVVDKKIEAAQFEDDLNEVEENQFELTNIDDNEIEIVIEPLLPAVVIEDETFKFVKPVIKLNGRNGEANDSWSVKSGSDVSSNMDKVQLTVAAPVTKNNAGVEDGQKKMEVIFTQKRSTNNNEVHQRYNRLKGNHGLDEKSGVPRNVTMNVLSDFDLFAESTPKETEAASAVTLPQVVTPASSRSPFDLKSPDYDDIDDFENYYQANFRQESNSPKSKEKSDQNKNLLTLKPQEVNAATKSLKVKGHEPECGGSSIISGGLKSKEGSREMSCQDNNLFTPQLVKNTTKPLKRKQITFAEEQTVCVYPKLPQFELRVTLYKLDLESLANYKKMEKREYKKRKRRDVNTTTTPIPSTPTTPRNLDTTIITPITSINWRNDESLKMLQVTYDKSTPGLSQTDTIQYVEIEEQAWRTKSNYMQFDEGQLVGNGQKNGKRKIQRSGVPDEHGNRKRGRPRKTT